MLVLFHNERSLNKFLMFPKRFRIDQITALTHVTRTPKVTTCPLKVKQLRHVAKQPFTPKLRQFLRTMFIRRESSRQTIFAFFVIFMLLYLDKYFSKRYLPHLLVVPLPSRVSVGPLWTRVVPLACGSGDGFVPVLRRACFEATQSL